MQWQPIDTTDPANIERHYSGDPAELVDALIALLLATKRPAWHAHAACRGQGPRAWFPSRGQGARSAQAICADCPVRVDCLRAGRTEHGIWGGTSERVRRLHRS